MADVRILATLLISALPAIAFADASSCSALQTEVENLRARVKQLEAAALPATASTPASISALPGTAAKPPPQQYVVVEEPYSTTGCSRGLLKGIPPGKWQDTNLWSGLEKGQSPGAVEALLGAEHYDASGGGNVMWQYGKCGKSSMAQVLFSNGKLADWRAPSE